MEISKIINEIYEKSPYKEGTKNETHFPESVGSPIYGEIMYEGTEAIINKFSKHFNNDTVFYDLGCGLGKMVLHIGLKYNPKKSMGIEYSKERANTAKEIKEKYAKDKKNIIIEEGNVLNFDLSDATVIYMDNTVFPTHINKKIFQQLPKGCLVLYKKKFPKFENIEMGEQNLEENLVKRTYHQTALYWTIK